MAPTPQAASNLRSPGQNRRIHGIRAALAKPPASMHPDDIDTLVRDTCRQVSGQEHTSKLTVRQANTVIAQLEAALAKYSTPSKPAPAPHEPWGKRGPGTREEQPITAFQQQVIHGLFNLCAQIGAGFENFAQRRAFSQRQCKVDWPETLAQADKLIEPLSEIACRKVNPSEFAARVHALNGDKRLDRWKRDVFIADLVKRLETQPPKQVLTPGRLVKLLECEAWVQDGGR